LSADQARASNLARAAALLAEPPALTAIGDFDGVRCVSHDRLPFAGAVADEAAATAAAPSLRGAQLEDLPRQDGAFACFALGSRGLTLAPLLGELIAARIEGEPWPVESDLAAAVDPARFLLQALRRGLLRSQPAPISETRADSGTSQ
jgi:tRNA 5-methylaminomethyl-2-thiouridine biosynthesis bifunctional protein